MRSRLEASWAAAFDNHDLSWEYEPRAFADQTGQYLPDFYLPTRDLYIEIKPTLPSEGWTAEPLQHPALRRMEIIWSSIPDARLAVFIGGPDDQHLVTYRTDSANHEWWCWWRVRGSDFYLWAVDPSHGSR